MRSLASPLIALLCWLLLPCVAHAQDLHLAEQHLLTGHAEQATRELHAVLARDPNNGAAHLLLCRVQLSTLHGSDAAAECRLALKSGLDRDAAAQDWAGRAFGMEAEHAGPIAGLKLANQVHSAFEAAFRLNPRSPAAANDLGEYYVHAPFIVGGGTDKAVALATSLHASLPEISERLQGLVEEKHENYVVAERHFVAATQVAQSPGAYIDLATFFARRNDMGRSAAAARKAIQLDRALDADVVDAAGALNDAHQPAPAMQALRGYLDHGQQSDQAPAFRAHTMLGQMLAAGGDRAGARREFTAALALAPDYAPAQKGLATR